MAVLTMPDGSALKTIQAAKYGVQVNLGTVANPIWTFVNGLQNFEPKTDPKLEDDTDISSDGWESMANAGNAFTVDFDGLIKGEQATQFIADPGMYALKAAAEKTGSDGHVHMRYWRVDDLPDAKEFFAAVKASLKGGKPNELQKFGGSLTGRGKPKDIVKPTATTKTLTVGAGVTAFTITADGATTASISNGSGGATATAVQTAIRALPGQGGATVVGNAGGPFTITLVGTIASVTATGTGGTVTVA